MYLTCSKDSEENVRKLDTLLVSNISFDVSSMCAKIIGCITEVQPRAIYTDDNTGRLVLEYENNIIFKIDSDGIDNIVLFGNDINTGNDFVDYIRRKVS